MKTCPECATPTTVDAATCVVCGARLDPEAPGSDDEGAHPAAHDRPDDQHPDNQTTVPQEIDMPTETPETTVTSEPVATPETPQAPDSPDTTATSEQPSRSADVDGAGAPSPGDASPGSVGTPDGHDTTPDQPDTTPQGSAATADEPPAPAAAWPDGSGQAPPPEPPAAPPAPGAVPLDESVRNWGLLAHVSGLVASALVGMGFVGPLVVWLLKRDEHPFVAQNAAEALNFQLSMLLYGALLVVASLPVITLVVTLPLALVGFVLWVVLPIVAAVRASRGDAWTYPITIGFVRP